MGEVRHFGGMLLPSYTLDRTLLNVRLREVSGLLSQGNVTPEELKYFLIVQSKVHLTFTYS